MHRSQGVANCCSARLTALHKHLHADLIFCAPSSPVFGLRLLPVYRCPQSHDADHSQQLNGTVVYVGFRVTSGPYPAPRNGHPIVLFFVDICCSEEFLEQVKLALNAALQVLSPHALVGLITVGERVRVPFIMLQRLKLRLSVIIPPKSATNRFQPVCVFPQSAQVYSRFQDRLWSSIRSSPPTYAHRLLLQASGGSGSASHSIPASCVLRLRTHANPAAPDLSGAVVQQFRSMPHQRWQMCLSRDVTQVSNSSSTAEFSQQVSHQTCCMLYRSVIQPLHHRCISYLRRATLPWGSGHTTDGHTCPPPAPQCLHAVTP